MDSTPLKPETAPLARLPAWGQWLAMLAISGLFSWGLDTVHMPAALLIGPLIVGAVAGVNGATVRVPKPMFGAAQAVVGTLVASAITLEIFSTLVHDWMLVLFVVLSTIVASSLTGWVISRFRILPGTTGVWGSAPGAATAMVLMAGAFGADQRLVAFMQYLRVVCVTFAAALVARYWVDTSGVEAPHMDLFAAIDVRWFAVTVAVAAAGALFGAFARLPSPYFLGAFVVSAIVHLGLDVPLVLPQWLLAASYALIGWTIGLNFTMPIVRHAVRALPQVMGSILALIAFCGCLAWMIVEVLGVDPLTAYLATSPGGMDSVAIIAAASHRVDMSFVMALQAARFLVVLILGPTIAKLVARSIR